MAVAKCFAIVCCSSSFFAPTTLSTIFPSFRNMNVGIASTAQSWATDCKQGIFFMRKTNVSWTNNVSKTNYKICKMLSILAERNFIIWIFFTFSSSTSTLRNVTFGNFLASSARNGAMKRHGPHQEAVKSTTICINYRAERMLRMKKPVKVMGNTWSIQWNSNIANHRHQIIIAVKLNMPNMQGHLYMRVQTHQLINH